MSNSAYPLIELIQTIPAPQSPLHYFVRDQITLEDIKGGRAKTRWEDIEKRRKDALRPILAEWKAGKDPFLVILQALEATIGNDHGISDNLETPHNLADAEARFLKKIEKDKREKEKRKREQEIWRSRRPSGEEGEKEEEPEPEKTPEELHVEFMKGVEARLARVYAKDIAPDILARSPETLALIDSYIAKLENEPALEVVLAMTQSMLTELDRGHDFGKWTIPGSIYNRMEWEERLFSAHENDPFIDPDTIKTFGEYKRRESWERERTRDQYLFEHEIELRRTMQIIGVLNEWKNGKHPIHVLHDLMQIGMGDSDSAYYHLVDWVSSSERDESEARREAPHRKDWSQSSIESRLVRALNNKERLRLALRDALRDMKPEIVAFHAGKKPEFAEEIDKFIKHVEEEGGLSLDIIRNVAENMLRPVNDHPGMEGYNPLFRAQSTLSKIVEKLEGTKQEEREKFDASKPMGPLETQTEAQLLAPLAANFNRMAQNKARRNGRDLPKMCAEIHLEPSGAGGIKPYMRPRRIRPPRWSWEYDKIKDPEGEIYEGANYAAHYYEHDPEGKSAESIYGTTIARVTTYSMTFVPKSPSDLFNLRRRVQAALKRIAALRPDFGLPFVDYVSREFAYKRPYMKEHWGRRNVWNEEEKKKYPKYQYENCDVQIVDGKVQVLGRLDLDDVWNLYYLLEEVIEPTPQIANEMNRARYAEERGMLETREEERGGTYTNVLMRPEEQMGSLNNADPVDFIPESVHETLQLYAIGEIDEGQLLQRTISLADDTLVGRLVDAGGLFPTHRLLTDRAEAAGGAVVPYNQSLTERTRDLLMLMAGVDDEKRPLYPALIARVQEISRPLRDQLQERAHDAEVEFFSRDYSSSGGNFFGDIWDEIADRHGMLAGERDDLDDQMKKTSARAKRLGASDKTARTRTVYDTYRHWQEKRRRQDIMDGKIEEEGPQNALAARSNLAAFSGVVGMTSLRSWRDTDYVSRPRDSLWVRKELPAALAAFIKPYERPSMETAVLALTSENGLG